MVLGGYPAYLRRALGLTVEEWSPMTEGETNGVRFGRERRVAACAQWCDVLHLEGARALVTYARDFFAGSAAVTVNACGAGAAYYVGTQLAAPELARVLDGACARAEVGSVLAGKRVPKNVEMTLREKAGARFLFLLNHGAKAARVALPAGWMGTDLLTGRAVGRVVRLDALGVSVVALA